MNNHKEIKPTAVSVPRKGSAGSYSFACFRAVVGNFIMSRRMGYIPGQLLNGVVFIREIDKGARVKRMGRFVCPFCGKPFEASFNNVQQGTVMSCGCHQRVVATHTVVDFNSTHLLTGSREYSIWAGIKSRCYNKNHDAYCNYGGRGIIVCDEWKDDFKAFYDYVVTLSYYGDKGMTLDREDNDGDYEPNNLRWVTNHVQGINQRKRLSNKSDVVGVCKIKGTDSWGVALKYNGHNHWIGTAKSPIDGMWMRNDFIIENELWEYPIQKWKG